MTYPPPRSSGLLLYSAPGTRSRSTSVRLVKASQWILKCRLHVYDCDANGHTRMKPTHTHAGNSPSQLKHYLKVFFRRSTTSPKPYTVIKLTLIGPSISHRDWQCGISPKSGFRQGAVATGCQDFNLTKKGAYL